MISIHVTQLSKKFGPNTILKGLTFRHNKGILGITGPNGSGKSTLMQCLSGLLSPTKGEIIWKEADNTISKQEITRYLGYAAPYISLYGELSVAENLKFLARLRKIELKKPRITDVLQKVELTHVQNQPYQQLSTGQQQRARLASAIFMNPPVLFLDEPGSNLDEDGRKVVSSLLQGAQKDHKLVVLASNNPAELQQCDRLLSVVDGSMELQTH